MIPKLRRKECETPKERAQPCLEVGMQMRECGRAVVCEWWRGGVCEWCRRCVSVVAPMRESDGAVVCEWCRRCVSVAGQVRECGGALGWLCGMGVIFEKA